MKYFSFNNGDQMPVLGLGTWKSQPGEVYEAVKAAIEIGYRHIDCAFIYQNEAEIGKAIAESIEKGLVKRQDLWITSKLWNDAHHPDDVKDACQQTLKDLGLDYLDLYLVHWPVAHPKGIMLPGSPDQFLSLTQIPLAETWGAMENLKEEGLSRHVGVSNFSIKKLELLAETARVRPAVNQIEMHPYLQQKDMLAFGIENHMYLTAYSPLGSLDRPKELKAENEPVLLEDDVIKAIAENHQVSPAQVLIAWAIHRGTSVIPKSVNVDRLKQNFEAATLELSGDDMKRINSLDKHRRYVDGSFWTPEGSPYTMETLWDE
jgi:alcohol dehydrogenase (NADP+)